MRIISKYKDYYDYLVGLKGLDDKIVLDRRKKSPGIVRLTVGNVYTFHICGMHYDVICDKSGKYHASIKSKTRILREHYNRRHKKKYTWLPTFEKFVEKYNYANYMTKEGSARCYITPQPSTLNDKHDCPIIMIHHAQVEYFPNLSLFNIPSIIPAEEMWSRVYNWISSRIEKPIIDSRTDVQKVESAGFDKITSFRNM